MEKFSELEHPLLREIVLNSSCYQIVCVLTNEKLQNADSSPILSSLISLLTEKEWTKKYGKCDKKYQELFLLLIRGKYPHILNNITNLEDSLWEI